MYSLSAATALGRNLKRAAALTLLGAVLAMPAYAQDDSKPVKPLKSGGTKAAAEKAKPEFSIGGYVDAYYHYYSDSTGGFSQFATVSPRNNNVGLNMAMLNAKYSSDRFRGQMTLQFGDIASSSWETRGQFSFLQNANAGVRLAKNLWLDAGLFNTHIGTELLMPKDNITSTLAIGTWHEPYYHAGAELSYKFSDVVFAKLIFANGYGANGFVDNNKNKAVGFLVSITPKDGHSIGVSGIYSDESPDGNTENYYRFYQNAYYAYSSDKIKFTIGGDFGAQLNTNLDDPANPAPAFVASGLAALKYYPVSFFGLYGRGEVFYDKYGILTGTPAYTMVYGGTFGLEAKPSDNSYIRVEGRYLQNKKGERIYNDNGSGTAGFRYEVGVNLGVYFDSGNLLKN